MQTREALKRAEQNGLDLVEIAPQAKPPVCRIMDYGKYKYDQEKKNRQSRKNQSQVKLKEIKFHANVEEHDYETKLRHAREFLNEGHRVKFSLFFRGRENAHRERGFEVMHQVQKDCEKIANVDQTPTLVGRNIIMMVSPRTSQANKS